jgi:hypothetical protein
MLLPAPTKEGFVKNVLSVTGVLILLLSIPVFSKAKMRVPAGFEELARGQTVIADVYLYGQFLGAMQVRADLESITFMEPDALVRAVRKVYGDAPGLSQLVLSQAQHPMDRNGNLACSTNGNRTGCDYLKTDSLGLIYDENNAVIRLFISDRYPPLAATGSRYYDSTPEAGNALVHQQNINFATSGHYQSLSVQGNGALGVGESSFLGVDWSWLAQRSGNETAQQLDASNAYFRQDFLKRIYLQAGVMDERDIYTNAGGNITLAQLPIGRIRGLRIGSTLAWLNRETVSAGTPVSVLLNHDARVDAYRNNQLLSTFYLKAGAQMLDTRSFPSGSYTLTLRIYENNQLVRTETQLYSRQGQGWASDFQWFLQAGMPDDSNVTNGTRSEHERYAVHAGGRLPLTKSSSITAGAAVYSSAQYAETAAEWSHGFESGPLDGLLSARLSWLQGSEGSRGSTQQVTYNDGFSLSFYRTALTAGNCNLQNAHAYGAVGCYRSTNAMLSVPVAGWNGTLGYSVSGSQGRYVYRRDLPTDNADYANGAPWERVYQSHSRSETWQAGINRVFVLNNFSLGTSFSAFASRSDNDPGLDKGLYFSFSLSGVGRQDNRARHAASIDASWQQSRRGDSQLGYGASYTRYQDASSDNAVGASFSGVNTDIINGQLYARAEGQYGSGSLALSDAWDKNSGTHNTGSSGTYSSSLVMSGEGVSLGRWGTGQAASALSVTVGTDIDEEDGPGTVTVSMDGGASGDVVSGRRRTFLAPGYQKTAYSVNESLATPEGMTSEIRKGMGRSSLFLPPGKLLTRNVAVETRYIWLGRLLDEQQRPLDGGIPLNVATWSPVGDGGFTMETNRKINALYVMRSEGFWRCRIKVRAVRDVVRYLGATACSRTDLAALPEAEHRQARLLAAGAQGEAKPVAMSASPSP